MAKPKLRVALDAMGGDFAPAAVVEGAVWAVERLPAPPEVVLVGDAPRIEVELAKHGRSSPLLTVRHASQVIEMADHPGQAIRQKRDSSLRVCFELMASGEVNAVVSAGNSGALLAGALLVGGRLPEVERPAIAAVLPRFSGPSFAPGRTLLLDAGANTDCKPIHLVQFALMGAVYARAMLGAKEPRIAVLSNGEEATKGTDLTRAAAEALSALGAPFVGYAEGTDLFGGVVDVAVCDGFVGNLILKSAEGVAQAIVGSMRQSVRGNVLASLGMLLARPALRPFREALDWEAVGGAPLLGINGVGIVAHGRSSPKAILNAVRVAAEAAAFGLGPELSEAARRGAELCSKRRVAEG